MSTADLFEEAKIAKKAKTWDDLADEIGITGRELRFYRKGERVPDVYTCFKLAEILNKSQAEVLAAFHAEKEKNESKRLYFKRFFSTAALWIILVGLSGSFTTFSENAHAHGTGEKVVQNHSVTCVLC
ncbi:hypothetical protein LG202_08910 [Methylobacillus methanolivorans]